MLKNQKIAFIIEKFSDKINSGGEPRINFNLCKYLVSLGAKVDIYCQECESNIYNYTVFNQFYKNKNTYINKINNKNYDIIISSRFGLKFSEIEADIYTIHSHSDLFSQKRKYGYLYNIIRPKNKSIKNEIENLTCKKDKLFIFCSKQLQKDYCSICKLEKNFVMNPYPNFTPNEKIKNKNNIFVFGINALGFENKGGYLILKSAFLLKLIGKKFKLKIIYKKQAGPLQKMLTQILGLKKYVEFIPKQKDMQTFYKSINCLCMPSKIESFGMVALEAMSFGLPVIVSSTSGITEKITDMKNGLIFSFNCNKVFNLFEKMKFVLDNKNSDIIKNNLQKTHFITENEYNYNFLKIIDSITTNMQT